MFFLHLKKMFEANDKSIFLNQQTNMNAHFERKKKIISMVQVRVVMLENKFNSYVANSLGSIMN